MRREQRQPPEQRLHDDELTGAERHDSDAQPDVEPHVEPHADAHHLAQRLGPRLPLADAPAGPADRDREARTGAVSSQPFGQCAKFDVLTIGAEQAVQRTFVAGTASSAQQIATFPDTTNTARAEQVLLAWHRKCHPGGLSVHVGATTTVPVSHGHAWWYLVRYRTHPGLSGGSHGAFESFGVVATGTRISMIRMDHDGQDHDYPPGHDPMELAVKAAASKLG